VPDSDTETRHDNEGETARRAHEISQSDESGTDEENWLRAERELREMAAAKPARKRKQG
jgi:hypothetical protein